MHSFSVTVVGLLVASASMANAALTIINHCTAPLYIKEAHANLLGGCDMGPDKSHCYSNPWVVNQGATTVIPTFNNYGVGTSVKISRNQAVNQITQFEYTPSDNIYWDVSDLDGQGSGRVGSPFQNDNIMASPGTPTNTGTCKPVLCAKNQICDSAYQTPNQVATRACQKGVQDFTFEFCASDAEFAAAKAKYAKRAIAFVS